jgi:NAD-dependent deacetylase
VVWFGETLPEDAVDRAVEAARLADVVLVIGTSGVVYPAAGFVEVARGAGARVVDVNPEGSALPADVALRLPAGEAVPMVLG